MAIELLRADLTNLPKPVDALVNTANPSPLVGSGLDYSIYDKAGPELLAAREAIGQIPQGESRITPAFGLAKKAKYIIHCVATFWLDGNQQEEAILCRSYASALQIAWENGCKSIAFSLMGTGAYRFPQDRALYIAISAFTEFLLQHDMVIYLALFDKKAFHLASRLVPDIHAFVNTDYVERIHVSEYGGDEKVPAHLKAEQHGWFDPAVSPIQQARQLIALQKSLKKDSFLETVLAYMQEKDLHDPDVYRAGRITKQQFNRMMNQPDAGVSRGLAIKIAFGLGLDLTDTKALLELAGYAFPNASETENILSTCFRCHIREYQEVDKLLVENGQEPFFERRG